MLLDFADMSLTQKGKLYSELYNKLKKAVVDGILKKGEKLPSVREAAAQLSVSRTTVENAYSRLCIEGIAESIPQKGYFIIGVPKFSPSPSCVPQKKQEIIYDFSSRSVDALASDIDLWKRLVRSVLLDSWELNSYGDPQGEPSLRQALANYSYKARGVIALADNIIIGAGVGPLLNIICGLLERDITVGFENGGFNEAKHIFSNYGIDVLNLHSDQNGATERELIDCDPDILFLLPSALSKISPTVLSARRNVFKTWANKNNRLIIEDDYNGELRYTARSIPAFQRMAPESTVYIGSFSKLLLPSVRIAYMVLPTVLAEKFRSLSYPYNQTCGKIEQLALEKYITCGALEKHLKKLRRLYYTKSQLMIREIEKNFKNLHSLKLFESSLTVEIQITNKFNPQKLYDTALSHGVKIGGCKNDTTIKLSFGGIDTEKIRDGINLVAEIFKNL
ncbi:MAG: PLP-dependent aminotransferase family protein [Clostridia bacterium]|nr:PLP-dependent aminotransferase family protein [Clostridia bacterium]